VEKTSNASQTANRNEIIAQTVGGNLEMNNIKKILFLGLIVLSKIVFGQNIVDSLITELRKPEFYPDVSQSKNKLVNLGEQTIPKLIEVLNDTSFVKLTNTGDLIYPGATEYYGHGYIIDYDLDWVSVRAAWVLEEITFKDFGYKQNQISEDDLLELRKTNYESDYLEKGIYKVVFKDSTNVDILKEYRRELAASVLTWWDTAQAGWTRFNALKEALNSSNSNRQHKALHYLRFEKTNCDGLTKDSFDKELKPLVQKIRRNGKDGTDLQARLLLSDSEYYWLKIKQK